MIEIPEAATMAGKLNGVVRGEKGVGGVAGHSPPKYGWD